MEIFTEEFKAELSNQLEALTNVVKKDSSNLMSNNEMALLMNDFNSNENLPKEFKLILEKEKKKKTKKFKLGDVVFFGDLMGEIIDKNKDLDILHVLFDNGCEESFSIKGEFCPDSPIVLSHFPYFLKMKKIKY